MSNEHETHAGHTAQHPEPQTAAPTDKAELKLSKLPPVERNGVPLKLHEFTIVKGDRKDQTYPGIVVDKENLNHFVTWLGIPNVVNVLQTFAKRACQSIWKDSIGEDGVFNEGYFLKELQDLASAGMKLKDIRDKLEELQATQAQLIQRAAKSGFTAELAKEITDLNTEILGYAAMAEKRSRKPDSSADKDADPAVAS